MRSQRGKYESNESMMSKLDILGRSDPQFYELTSELLNASLAKSSWRQIGTVASKIRSVEKQFKIKLTLPWAEAELVNFVAACTSQGLRTSTIKTYLGRIHTVHELLGWCKPPKSNLVKRMIAGALHLQSSPKKRLAVSPALMKELKDRATRSSWTLKKKVRKSVSHVWIYLIPLFQRLFWLTCCTLFHGSLRSSEILPKDRLGFAAEDTCLPEDIRVKTAEVAGERVRMLWVRVKRPKEDRTGQKEIFVEMFEQKEVFFCPVTAWRRFIRVCHPQGLQAGLPVMRTEDGRGYTGALFNIDIRALLGDLFDYRTEGIWSHSFRAGVSSVLAKNGFAEEIIKAQGRWASSCYQAYIKQGRGTQLVNQKKVANCLRSEAELPVKQSLFTIDD